MKVALVFPGITDIGFRSYGDNPDSSWISHGLCSISSCLKKAGHQVFLIDLRKLTGWEEYRQKVMEMNPDALCITMMSCDFLPGLRCAELAHQIFPNLTVIVGGPHPSIMPEEVLTHREFDVIVKGEGELSLVDLFASIQNSIEFPRLIQGELPDLDLLPYSDRELFGPYEVPIPLEGFNPPFMTFIASRGCRFNCAFCQPAERMIFGSKVRRRSPENFVGELIRCKTRYRFESYLIHDDCLLEDIDWLEKFCALMERNNIRVPFACQSRSDLICKYPEIIRKMKKIGLSVMIVGFESGNDRVLRFLRKGVRVEQNLKAAEILKEQGIKIWANYMLGIPTETRDEIFDTITMIKKINPDHCSPSIYTPHPGSDMFEFCRSNNLLLSLSHDSYRRNITEVKIKGQDWHVIEWAVSESTNKKSEIVPYSKDYISDWGELVNSCCKEGWHRIESSGPEKYRFLPPAVENLVGINDHTWRSSTIDPQFIWDFNPALQPEKWRYIVVDLEVDYSSRGQFFWWTNDGKYQATRHFRVKYGRNKYAFNLKFLKTFRDSLGDDIRWYDFPIKRLRFDPSESENAEIILHEFFLLGS